MLEAFVMGVPATGTQAASFDDVERRLPLRRFGASEDTIATPDLIGDALTVQQIAPTVIESSGTFVLTAVTIRGSTVFSPLDFAPLYEPYLTRRVTPTDIAQIAEDITTHYRNAGYFLSRAVVPPQDAAAGRLYVDIVEGYIADVVIEGADIVSVRARAQALTMHRPLRLSELETTLTLIGDVNGVSVTESRIEPNLQDMSAHRLILTVQADFFDASLYVDNRGTQAGTRLQTYARASVNTVLQDGDRLSVGVFTTPTSPKTLTHGEASYTIPVNRLRSSIIVQGAVSSADAGGTQGASRNEGMVAYGSARFAHAFVRRRSISLWGNAGFEYRNNWGERSNGSNYDDRLRILTGSLRVSHNAWNGTSAIFAQVSKGLDVFGASNPVSSLTRADARSDFLKAEAQISRYQNIGNTFGLYVAASSQISADALPASAEFTVGGAQFGRGYDYAAISGEHGLSGLVELRYGRNVNRPWLKFYQLYGYYDAGLVWNKNLALEFRKTYLTSAGVGLRLTLPESIYVNYEAAFPLSQSSFLQNDMGWRNFVSLSKNF